MFSGAHELVHSLYKNKKRGVILKLDYEKAYDRVSCEFLFEILESRGFSPTWICLASIPIYISSLDGVNLKCTFI